MGRVVVLKLSGNLEQQGFHVTLDVAQDGHFPALSEEGELPPNPELLAHLGQWQQDYVQLSYSCRTLKPYKVQMDGTINPLIDACNQSKERLATAFRQWLKSDSFRELELQLRRILAPDDVIRVLIRSTHHNLHALPWHLWPFIDDYPNAEIAMGSPRFQRAVEETPYTPSKTSKVRILAVLGDRQNIDIDTDRALLNTLPGAKVELLVEPSPQHLHEQLYAKSWDILFFAGHSDTVDGNQGIIRLNPTTSLTIEELKYALRFAINNGLQLAIFNSCNGLGLAHALADLQLPQLIVMREAVPDHVAHTFLKYFLDAFSKNTSLYQSARKARERLQGMEQDFPCASWLPVIYQHPAKSPPSWVSLRKPSRFLSNISSVPTALPVSAQPSHRSVRKSLAYLSTASFVVTTLVMGARLLGLWQPLEFWAFDHMMRSRPAEAMDDRIVLITVDEQDLRYQNARGYPREGSLSKAALAAVLQHLAPHEPIAVGVDILYDRPLALSAEQQQSFMNSSITDGDTHDMERIAKSSWWKQTNTFFICQVKTSGAQQIEISPPIEVATDHVGFSNLPSDPDHRVRRQFFGMSPSSGCKTDRSLSYVMASQYLAATTNLDRDRSGQIVRFNDTPFPKLERHQGAYHRVDMRGFSVLLNYRHTDLIAETIPLRELLEGTWDDRLSSRVAERVVLIGTTAPSYHDYHLTPYGEMSGVEIHAHMISQILSAVLDDRPLLHVLPQWGDVLLVLGWTLVTGGIMLAAMRRISPYLVVIGLVASLWGAGTVTIRSGLWLPLVPMAIASTAIVVIFQRHDFLSTSVPFIPSDQ